MTSIRPGLAAAVLMMTACSDATAPDPQPVTGTVVLNGATGWSYARLGAAAPLSGVADPSTSTEWDLAVFATSVMLNGGAAGPGGMQGYCVCQNAAATNAQVQGMTAQSELADFEAVTAASVPTDDSLWQSDRLAPAVSGWYAYDAVTHAVSAVPARVWAVRTAEGTGYAKIHVTALQNPTRDTPGRVTLEYAVQTARGAAMGETRTVEIDVPATGRVHFDLLRGAVSDASDWDLAFEGYAIRVNGGVSGSGQAGAVALSQPFGEVADASSLTPSLYRGDAFGGVFDAKRWYRYNLTGADHQVWPTFEVYLLRRGSQVWKVQLIGYYGPAGEPRQISIRYARVVG